MNMEAIQALGVHDEIAPGAASSTAALPAAAGVPFSARISEGLQGLNQQLLTTQADLQKLALGDAGDLHEIMIRLEESRMALQLMLQVRNRVLEAYQDVMRMQV